MKVLKTDAPLLDKAALRQAVIQRLSKREHSRFELLQKLSDKAESLADLEEILDDMVNRGWQSDARYAEIFCRDRALRYGPIKIRFELKNRGIHEALISQTLEACETDWFEQAREIRQRKFEQSTLSDMKVKAKAYRFLAQRGFSSEQISYALAADESY